MHYELHTEIEIDAPPEVVWEVLTDFATYGEWNPFVTSAEGIASVGHTLVTRFEPPGGRAATLKPKVTVVDNHETLEWLGHIGLPGLLDGRHRFELEATSTGTRVVQSEQFDGVLVRLFRKSINTTTRAGFEAMNQALKSRAELVAVA